jgi:hypothetical protein
MFDNEKCGTKPIVYSGSVQSLAFILLTIICIPSTLFWQLC